MGRTYEHLPDTEHRKTVAELLATTTERDALRVQLAAARARIEALENQINKGSAA